MSEHAIRGLLDEVRAGRLSRRAFVQSMVSLGLTVPLAGQLLAGAGLAQTSPRPGSAPAKRGGGGALADPATGSPAVGGYKNVKLVEALDPHTVKVSFSSPHRSGR